MGTLIKYRLRCLLKNKSFLFWTAMFPIVLCTLFSFVFSNMNQTQTIQPIHVAVVDEGNQYFKQVVDELSKPDAETYLLKPTYTNEVDGRKLLNEVKVDALILNKEHPVLVYTASTLNIQVLESIIQQYEKNASILATLATNQSISAELMQDIVSNHTIIEDSPSSANANFVMMYYYAAIAMACLLGGEWGLISMRDSQANQSAKAVRLNVAPTKKSTIVMIDFVLGFAMMAVFMVILFVYLINVLNIQFGDHLWISYALSCCGIFASLAGGMCLGSLSKLKFNANISIMVNLSLVSCFLAGMMIGNIQYILDGYLPFLKYINPATLISRGFSILYYYNDISEVYLNMAILLGMGVVLLIMSSRVLRRKAYASI